jgi:hypothetical protein
MLTKIFCEIGDFMKEFESTSEYKQHLIKFNGVRTKVVQNC